MIFKYFYPAIICIAFTFHDCYSEGKQYLFLTGLSISFLLRTRGSKLNISKWLPSVNEGFELRFEDVYCNDAFIWTGNDVNCQQRCASDDKCKYFSQWLQTSTYCQTYSSCTTQSTDKNKNCVVKSNGNSCPIKTFEKIGTFLND